MAYGLIPLINGKANEWADIVMNIFGLPFTMVTKINYEETQDMKDVLGAGNRVVARIHGAFSTEVSISILMNEVENIQAVAPLGKLQAIPEFPIVISYVDPSLPPRTHTLNNCRFMNNGRSSERGGGEIEVEFKIICSDISFV